MLFRKPDWPFGGLARLALRRPSPWRRRSAERPRFDLLEPWEQVVDEPTARAHTPSGVHGLPYRPRRTEDLPDGAFGELRRAVGADGAQQLIVLPARIRHGHLGDSRNGGGRRPILTPAGVLGFGPGGVALWIGAPALPGVRVALEPRQVAAIGTTQVLLDSRLTILAAHARLDVHYNAVAERALLPLVRNLRRHAARSTPDLPPDLPDAPVPNAELPYKWRQLLASDAVRLDAGEPVAVVAGALPVPKGSEAAYAAVVLTPRELVVLADPLDTDATGGRHGVDTHFVPRANIEEVRDDGPLLRVRVQGADLQLPLGRQLSTRTVRAFAHQLPIAAQQSPLSPRAPGR